MMVSANDENSEAGVVKQSVAPCWKYQRQQTSPRAKPGRNGATHGKGVPNVHDADVERIARELQNTLASSSSKDAAVISVV